MKNRKYRIYRMIGDAGAMQPLEDSPMSTRKADIDKWIKENAETLLRDKDEGLSLHLYIFAEPYVRTLTKETRVTVK